MISVTRVISEYLSSNMYVLSENGRCIVIDPCDSGCDAVEGFDVDAVFLTHEHFDHISGTELFSQRHGAQIYAGELCAARLNDPVLNCSRHFNAFAILRKQPCRIKVGDYRCTADRIVQDRQTLNWQGHEVVFYHTPGHLDSCFSLYVDGMLFTGDAVMYDENGVPAVRDRHYASMNDEITFPLLRSLPEHTMVYPGHGEHFELSEYISRL